MVAKVFSGGEKLEAVLHELAQKVSQSGTLEVGFMEGATQPSKSKGGAPVSIPMIAAISEFGAPSKGIPPRPYFRGMIAKGSPQWGGQIGALLKAANYDAPLALDQMGEEIEGQLIESIRDFKDPKNADSTIAKKGFDDPLIQDGDMLRAVKSRVKT